jgi:probable addiction module antidote protein
MTIETRPFDPSAYLDTPEAVLSYLDGAFADGDPVEIGDALGVVARARWPAMETRRSRPF